MAPSSSFTTEAQLKNEIARLTASINQHKLTLEAQQQSNYGPPRSKTYVNSNFRSSKKYVRPGLTTSSQLPPEPHPSPSTSSKPPAEVKEVVLNGVAFESSGRSLVRKDRESFGFPPAIIVMGLVPHQHNVLLVPKPPSGSLPTPQRPAIPPHPVYPRKHGHPQRVYKPKASRSRNMTLTNYRRPYQTRRTANKSRKYSNKPCPRFTTTGTCNRGLTCMYQHDPSKIAICWNFLQDNCPKTADTCNLSHDPTPERTPLCLHFLNKGRCTREKCPFPHVNIGARRGICRDFAVLGYCDKGLDCDKQHVRECPDFAENGTCTIKGCKLPHVIRANRNRKTMPSAAAVVNAAEAPETDGSSLQPTITVEDAHLGDEYISLTFNESSDDDTEEDDEADSEDDDSEVEEASDPQET